MRDLDGETRLAHARDTDQRDQPVPEHGGNEVGDFRLATDQHRAWWQMRSERHRDAGPAARGEQTVTFDAGGLQRGEE